MFLFCILYNWQVPDLHISPTDTWILFWIFLDFLGGCVCVGWRGWKQTFFYWLPLPCVDSLLTPSPRAKRRIRFMMVRFGISGSDSSSDSGSGFGFRCRLRFRRWGTVHEVYVRKGRRREDKVMSFRVWGRMFFVGFAVYRGGAKIQGAIDSSTFDWIPDRWFVVMSLWR